MMRRILARVAALAVAAVVTLSGCGESKPSPANSGAVSGLGVPAKAGPSLPPPPKSVD